MAPKTLLKIIIAAIACGPAASAFAEQIDRLYTAEPNAEYWRITEPTVTRRFTTYPQIVLHGGDKVRIAADGCVQTGGRGRTWKRYVNPDFGALGLYHGQVAIPGLFNGYTNLQDVVTDRGWSPEYVVSQNGGPLTLGYTDDQYDDNGYYAHDDGVGDQCKGVGSAIFSIYIRRAT